MPVSAPSSSSLPPLTVYGERGLSGMAAPTPPSRTWPSSLGPAPARRVTGASSRRMPWMATSTRVNTRSGGGVPAGGEAGVGAVVIGLRPSQVVGGVDDGALARIVDEGVLDVERV